MARNYSVVKGKQLTNDVRQISQMKDPKTGINFLTGAIKCSPEEALAVITYAARVIGDTERGNIKVKYYHKNTKKIKNPSLAKHIKSFYSYYTEILK